MEEVKVEVKQEAHVKQEPGVKHESEVKQEQVQVKDENSPHENDGQTHKNENDQDQPTSQPTDRVEEAAGGTQKIGQSSDTLKRPRMRPAKFPADVQQRIDSLKEKIENNKYDAEAWESLVGEIKGRQQSGDVADILRQIYSDMLEVFPTSAEGWRGYVELEINSGNATTVKSLLSECLLKTKNLDLWKAYIKFGKKVNDASTASGACEIKQAYEFTLDQLGTDINSGPLWQEYIQFLQQSDATILFGQTGMGNEESAKLMSVRRAYKRAVTVPTHNIEALWREYESFENNINKQLAKQIINELQPLYAQARISYRELKKKWENIKATALATPPNSNSTSQLQQQASWSTLIAFEKTNPLKLEKSALTARVSLIYDQCLMCLYHYPEIWYDYATWHAQNERNDLALKVFRDSCDALPACAIMHFAAADFAAAHDNKDVAKNIYESLLESQEIVEDNIKAQIWIQYMRFLRRTEGAPASRKLFLRARKSESCSHHVYSAAALLEWQYDKDMKVCKNIFELGLKSFLQEVEYVLEYTRFLLSQADLSNARALFERALTVGTDGNCKAIWNEYLKFEYQCGDLGSALSLEQRRDDALRELEEDENNVSSPKLNIGVLLLRYHANNLLPCSESMLGHLQSIGSEEAKYLFPDYGNVTELPQNVELSEEGELKESIPVRRPNTTSSSLPRAVSDMIKRLPLAYQLSGPIPTVQDVDLIIGITMNADLHSLRKLDDNKRGGQKRSAAAMSNSKQGFKKDQGSPNMPPKNDIYRMRQQQRQKIGLS